MKKLYTLIITVLFLQITQAQWKSIAHFSGAGRDGAISFVINDIPYVGVGILNQDFYSYNATANSWKKLKDHPKNKSFAAAFTLNGKGYIVGGDLAFGQPTNEVWEYDPVNDNWTQKNNFPAGSRVGMVVFQFDNRVFVGGGTNSFTNQGYGTIYKDMYEYYPASDTWVRITDLPTTLAFASGFVVNGKAYVCLGATANATFTKDLHEFDTTTKTWTKKTDFPGAARDGGVACAINSKGYVGLGQTNFSATYSDVYEYNISTNSWTKLPDYPNNKTGWATAFVINSTAYVGTGATVTLDFSNEFYSYSPIATGFTKPSTKTLSVYPNPFTNSIDLSGLDDNTDVQLTDITGKTLLTANTTHQKELNTENLKTGIYFLHTPQGTMKMVK